MVRDSFKWQFKLQRSAGASTEKTSQHVADGLSDDEIGISVGRGRIAVDDDGAASAEILNQPGGRINRHGGSSDDQQVSRRDGVDCSIYGCSIQGFSVQHHVGLDDPAAGAERHTARVPLTRGDAGQGIERPAPCTVVAVNGSVQLKHALRSGFGMQPVNILGDYACPVHFPLGFQSCQRLMGGIRTDDPGIKHHLIAVKAIKCGGLAVKEASGEDSLGRVIVGLIVEPVHTPKNGNPRLGGYSRAAEEHNAAGRINPLTQLLDLARNSFLKEPPKDYYEEYARKVIYRAYFIILNMIDEFDGTNEKLLEEYRKYIEKCIKL